MNNESNNIQQNSDNNTQKEDKNNVKDEIDDILPQSGWKKSQSIRQSTDNKQIAYQKQKDYGMKSELLWRCLQILNIFISLFFGITCLIIHSDIREQNQQVFYLIIFYMAISMVCFFLSLIILLIIWIISCLCQQEQQKTIKRPSISNTVHSEVNQNAEIQNSQRRSTYKLMSSGNYNNYNSNSNVLDVSIESEHSFIGFRQINQNQNWCNIGWFPIVYYSNLYIAYLLYIIMTSYLIFETWDQIPLIVSIFLVYVWIIGFLHIIAAIAIIFSKKFISRHIEEMEESQVYKIDESEFQRKRQEILDARNKDILDENTN